MKLILKEYLASLKERNELDKLLPELLSEMGLNVFSKPSIGTRQYGVDIAAYGRIPEIPTEEVDSTDKVFLFSVKGGDLDRSDWNSGNVQDLLPSLNDIINSYIPSHIPSEYKGKPIVICICFGGDLKERIRFDVAQYQENNKTDLISFSEWNGEKIAQFIEEYLLRENLVPSIYRTHLHKSLALIDEPNVSFKNFNSLVRLLLANEANNNKDKLLRLRQSYLSLWILFTWCRKENNYQSAILSSEALLLNSWEMCKAFISKKDKVSTQIIETFLSIQLLYYQINADFLETKIFPYSDKKYCISTAARAATPLDVNLKLFDLVGRIGLLNLWKYFLLNQFEIDDEDKASIKQDIQNYNNHIVKLINNNPLLLTPYKDSQAIEIFIAIYSLSLDFQNQESIKNWMKLILQRINFLYRSHEQYPCNLEKYHELLNHPKSRTDEYRHKVTGGSILYPYIAVIAGVFKHFDVFDNLKEMERDLFGHCNFQLWFSDEKTEDNYYTNDINHGSSLSHITLQDGIEPLLNFVFNECSQNNDFTDLSAIENGWWPIVFLASKHYGLPVPINFLEQAYKDVMAEGKLRGSK